MSISRKVLDSLLELGFTLSPKPKYEIPELPRDITMLDDEGLMDLFVQFTQWNDHLSGIRAIAVINEREAERALDTREAQLMLESWAEGSKQTVTLQKAALAANPEICSLKDEVDTKYAYRKIIETRAETVERDSQVVSRELTRRTSEISGFRSRARKFTT